MARRGTGGTGCVVWIGCVDRWRNRAQCRYGMLGLNRSVDTSSDRTRCGYKMGSADRTMDSPRDGAMGRRRAGMWMVNVDVKLCIEQAMFRR